MKRDVSVTSQNADLERQGRIWCDATYVELVDDCSHDVQNLCFSCVGHIAVVVNQNGLEQRRDHAGVDHFEIVRLLHVGVNELQDLLLDGPQPSDFGGFGGDAPWSTSARVNLLQECFDRPTVVSHSIIDELT